jgi:hypothetical protein
VLRARHVGTKVLVEQECPFACEARQGRRDAGPGPSVGVTGSFKQHIHLLKRVVDGV